MPNKIIPMSDEQAKALAGANLPNQAKFMRDAIRDKLATIGIKFPADEREWGEYARPKRGDVVMLSDGIQQWDEYPELPQDAIGGYWRVLRLLRSSEGVAIVQNNGGEREYIVPLRYIEIVRD